MNTTQLKSYAPKARHEFIEAVKARAAKFGITESAPVEMMVRDEVAMIYGEAYPKEAYFQRERVLEIINLKGYQQTLEAIAYTWFNRLMAFRYMELHGFLDHGYRVLSHPEGAFSPEILQHASHVELPDLDQTRVAELMLAGDQDEELYRMLLLAQCHALHLAMPFLFEPINDATELLLPDNLLHSDSLIRKMVNDIPEDDWETVEVIGWLYQFYISEKKDQVIGKVVKSEDIPAATQLFTPNWIVKYMVQNSLGAQWLATYPDSTLKEQMEYYIVPAEQTDEVNAQLAAITPSQLNPEELTLIDPASGSGHILVEAYELFKAIYLERGYRQRDVPQLILEKNLFGLDIDERAAQLTGFALMMKGRADDRRLFERGVKLNVMALVDSTGFDAEGLAQNPEVRVKLSDYELKPGGLTELKRLFEHATTFGSLIQVPEGLASSLPALKRLSEATSQDIFVSEALKRLAALVQQAELLAAQYDAVVANPPYMGSKSFNSDLKGFLRDDYKGYETDVFSAFIDRGIALSKPHGRLGFMSPFVWMFISSHKHLRTRLIEKETISSLVQLEYSGFEGATVPICTFTLRKGHEDGEKGCYVRLVDFRGSDNQGPKTLEAIRDRSSGWFFEAVQDEFKKIPGNPVAYWASDSILRSFESGKLLGSLGKLGKGSDTGKNELFIRSWAEVDLAKIDFEMRSDKEHKTGKKFYPTHKAGGYRKWFGFNDWVVDWGNDGTAIKAYGRGNIRNRQYYYQRCISWGKITSAEFSIRFVPDGSIADDAAPSAFLSSVEHQALEFLNSKITAVLLKVLSPTLNFQVGDVSRLPLVRASSESGIAANCIRAAMSDWNAYERSWDFQFFQPLTASSEPTPTLESSYTAWITQNHATIAEMKRLEEENNRLFIDAYGLADELTPDVPIEQITLTVNPAYRYGGKLTIDAQWTRFRQDTMEELISYAIGCMMGRYSLDAPGLIYAHSGNEDFNPSRYPSFPADDDGIVPLTDTEWFDDDATRRIVEFVSVAWDATHLEDNLTFLADNLKPKANESSRETIRSYLRDRFFKDHLKTYKKRPIYWLFSSGKQRALQCLVYLHRYNEGTLARMRMDYVVPLLGRLAARIEDLSQDIDGATTTAQANKLRRDNVKYKKQLEELRAFDEKLRHFSDRGIKLDLDDGVKVNYGKFGDLLAEVKAVHGKNAV